MHAIEKTALIESEIFFNAEEVVALETVKRMFATFCEVMKTIGEHSDQAVLKVQQINDETKFWHFDDGEIFDFLDTLDTFCQNVSVTISGEG